MQQRQLLVGIEGVIHEPVEQSRGNVSGTAALHHSRLDAKGCCLPEKPVPIEALPHQGNKQLAALQLAAIGADGAHWGSRIHTSGLSSAGFSPARDQSAKLHRIRGWMTR